MLSESPYWPSLQAYCLAFDGATEEYPWNEVVYKVKGKTFVFTSGDRPILGLTVKVRPEMKEVYLQQPGVSVAAYVGRFGWVALKVSDDASNQLARELIAESYAFIAKKRK